MLIINQRSQIANQDGDNKYNQQSKITSQDGESSNSDQSKKRTPAEVRNYGAIERGNSSHSRGRSFIRSHYMDSTEASRSRSRSISPLHPSHDIHPNLHRHNKIPSQPKVIKSIGLSKSHPNSEAFKRGLYYDTSTQKMRWPRSPSSSTSPRRSRSRSSNARTQSWCIYCSRPSHGHFTYV